MDTSRTLAELLITPGQQARSTGWLKSGHDRGSATLWFLRMHRPRTFVKLHGGSIGVDGPSVASAPRGVPVVVRGIWDGTSINRAEIREAEEDDLQIISVPGKIEHPGPLDLTDDEFTNAQQGIGNAARVFNSGGSKDTARHYVVTVTPELVDIVARGVIRTEIFVAVVPD